VSIVVEQEGNEDDLGAQTTYQVAIKPGNPVFVRMPLRFKDSVARSEELNLWTCLSATLSKQSPQA
jgi:hypothetical protein